MKKHIVIIGGGIAGTAAANTLVSYGYDVTIVEKNDYLGGRIHTHIVSGAAIEMGACFMTNFYTNLLDFVTANGFATKLYASHGNPGIVRDNQVRMATFRTLAGNSALSWHAKMRLVALAVKHLSRWHHIDHHAFWKAARYDTRSVADAFTGKDAEILEYLLQPGLNGYLYWTPEHTSEAMISNLFKAGIGWKRTYRMLGGLQRIPEQAAAGSAVLLDRTVTGVRRATNGRYTVTLIHAGSTETLVADGIVCATTASVVPKIIKDLDEQQKAFFRSIHYSSTAVVARVYQHDQLVGDKGIAFPQREGIPLAAVTAWTEHGSSQKIGSLRVYASGTIGEQLCAEPDEKLIRILTDLMQPVQETVLVGGPTPFATYTQRWPEALPLFDVGHLKRLAAFESGDIERPDQAVVYAGDYLGGPFMEGAFTSGIKAAERLHLRIS